MDVTFACECGHEISEFTRSNSSEVSFQIGCKECGAAYAVTVTQLRAGE